MELNDYNLLCAKFLGATVSQEYSKMPEIDQSGLVITFPKEVAKRLGIYLNYPLSGLKFHTDWNWIMEVVQKCEDLDYTVTIATTYADIEGQWTNIPDVGAVYSDRKGDRLQGVIETISNFLKWYYESKATEESKKEF